MKNSNGHITKLLKKFKFIFMKLTLLFIIFCIFTSSCSYNKLIGIPIKGRNYKNCPTNNRDFFYKKEGVKSTKKI